MRNKPYMAMSRNPVPNGRADNLLLHILETRGLLQTLCCGLSRGSKMTRNSDASVCWWSVATGACLLHTLGMSQVWALALLQAFGFDPLPYTHMDICISISLSPPLTPGVPGPMFNMLVQSICLGSRRQTLHPNFPGTGLEWPK